MSSLSQGTPMEDKGNGKSKTHYRGYRNSVIRRRILQKLEKGPLSTKEIAHMTSYSRRAVHDILKDLEEEGIIIKRFSLEDVRVRIWIKKGW